MGKRGKVFNLLQQTIFGKKNEKGDIEYTSSEDILKYIRDNPELIPILEKWEDNSL